MRILHTSDLHLGRSLYGVQRPKAFASLMNWLIETVRTHRVDCLIIAGDIYDSATPSNAAQTLYFRFLAELVKNTPCRHAIVVAGNHDSPTLVNASQPTLDALDVHVIGDATDNPADEVVLLKDEQGNIEAAVLAVPYLRERDVRVSFEHETMQDKTSRLIEGTRRHYEAVLAAALDQLPRDLADSIPIIATGHLFAAQTHSTGEERDLYIGSLGQIPADVFADRIDYVALGHIHRAQIVAGNPTRRYCGSPLALDFSEHAQNKCVLLVDIDRDRSVAVQPIAVPAFDRLERVTGTKQAIVAKLQELCALKEPLLCEVLAQDCEPGLAELCRQTIEGSQVELVRVIHQTAVSALIAPEEAVEALETRTPEEVFEVRLSKPDVAEEDKPLLRQAHQSILFELRQESAPEKTE